uniref:Uncharacterized protein n=1 Tax=Timema cristinae TaxID=61476 RepID=A0A7R9H284_TIMCR|nr:unnamed protein product [Timema cristinae]
MGLPYPCHKTSFPKSSQRRQRVFTPRLQVQHTYTPESVTRTTDSNSSHITQPQFTAQVRLSCRDVVVAWSLVVTSQLGQKRDCIYTWRHTNDGCDTRSELLRYTSLSSAAKTSRVKGMV